MPTTTNAQGSWVEYRRLVLAELSRLEAERVAIKECVADLESDVVTMKTTAMVAGTIGGFISGVIASVIAGIVLWLLTKGAG
jgi:hypothetical protein